MPFRVHPYYRFSLVKMKCLIYLCKIDNSVIIEKLNDTWLKYVSFHYTIIPDKVGWSFYLNDP